MKRLNQNIFLLILISAILYGISGCSGRNEESTVTADSTIIYPSKSINGVSANIVFCRRVSNKTGKRIGKGRDFTTMKDGKVRAIFDLKNLKYDGGRNLMFHIDWIGPNGKSIFLKESNISQQDSTSSLSSSISIIPEKRQPGIYKVRLYYFRELIAENSFELFSEFLISELIETQREPDIIFCSKVDKRNNNLIGVDSVFNLQDKKRIYAYFDLQSFNHLRDRELLFRFEWVSDCGDHFYKKNISIARYDSVSSVSSSISLSPAELDPGEYNLQLYLFDKLIVEKSVLLNKEIISERIKKNSFSADITFCRKISKKTGKLIGEGSIFEIGNKERVRAIVNLKNQFAYGDKDLEFILDWVGVDGKSFYKKKIIYQPDNVSTSINSSISIPPIKRQPGEYVLKVYLFDELITEKKFDLVSKSEL